MAASKRRRRASPPAGSSEPSLLRKKRSVPEKRALLENVYSEMQRLRGGKRATRLRWDEV